MFLIGHAAVGIVLASETKNPALAFGIGWLSHYLADFIPHGDEALGEWTKKGNEVVRLFTIAAVDGALLAATLAFVFIHNGFSWPLFAAAVGACMPDVLWGLEKLFHRKLFGGHERFHYRNHNFFHVRVPLAVGLVAQTIVTGGLWYAIIKG